MDGVKYIKRIVLFLFLGFTSSPSYSQSYILVDIQKNQVLLQKEATRPWYPASLTKLMTLYVALTYIQEGRATLQTPLKISLKATQVPPSKMGFPSGTRFTLENGLKMLLVKSANDVAVAVAESLAGSVEKFVQEMNARARQLHLNETHFVNPHGLPHIKHVSSARDMAILARALLTDFPSSASFVRIPAIRVEQKIILNRNEILGRYEGADGIKTGFHCAAGYNLAGSARKGERHLLVIVLGMPSSLGRMIQAFQLLDAGFASQTSQGGAPEDLKRSATRSAPDVRKAACIRPKKTGEWMQKAEEFLPKTDSAASPIVLETALRRVHADSLDVSKDSLKDSMGTKAYQQSMRRLLRLQPEIIPEEIQILELPKMSKPSLKKRVSKKKDRKLPSPPPEDISGEERE